MSELLASEPSAFVLPAELEKAPDVEITPSVVLLLVGVKVAEWELPEPEKPERVPPETETSEAVKSEGF